MGLSAVEAIELTCWPLIFRLLCDTAALAACTAVRSMHQHKSFEHFSMTLNDTELKTNIAAEAVM